MVLYFELTPETIAELQSDKTKYSAALSLLCGFVERCKDNSPQLEKDRFKVIAKCTNVNEIKCAYVMKSALKSSKNGKPMLINNTGYIFYRSIDPPVLEIDVDVDQFSNLKWALGSTSLPEMLKKMDVQLGFLIQGNDSHEQPEQMLGCVTLHKVDIEAARQSSKALPTIAEDEETDTHSDENG